MGLIEWILIALIAGYSLYVVLSRKKKSCCGDCSCCDRCKK